MRLSQETAAEGTLVCNIQHFSLHDGPGVRTTVFFKGCNLRCAWCHNPESITLGPQLAFDARRCIGCGLCAAACPRGCHQIARGYHFFDRSGCVLCMECAQVCPAQALWVYGEEMDEARILSACLRDRELYEISGGGVTFSGGECLLRPALIQSIGHSLKREGVSLCVDTALNVPWRSVERAMDVAALFLVDFKAFTPELHRRYTGADNALILENIRRLSGHHPYWIRIPLIRGVNDTQEETERMTRFLAALPKKPDRIDLIRFHAMGEWKYQAIGWEKRSFAAPGEARMEQLLKVYRPLGREVCAT